MRYAQHWVMTGKGALEIRIGETSYPSISAAARGLNLSAATVRRRLDDPAYPG